MLIASFLCVIHICSNRNRNACATLTVINSTYHPSNQFIFHSFIYWDLVWNNESFVIYSQISLLFHSFTHTKIKHLYIYIYRYFKNFLIDTMRYILLQHYVRFMLHVEFYTIFFNLFIFLFCFFFALFIFIQYDTLFLYICIYKYKFNHSQSITYDLCTIYL